MKRLTEPEICIVAACEETSRAMGRDNRLLWRLSADMKCFKSLTTGQVVIMGRKTYESLGSIPLPDRLNIVVSSAEFFVKGGAVTSSFDRALTLARQVAKQTSIERICFIGGERIFKEALALAGTLYLTLVRDPKAKGDVFFPPYDGFGDVVAEEAGLENKISFRFLTIKRKTAD